MLACLHAIVELTNDRDHNPWHVKTGEYCPEECSINGAVRFGKVDKAYFVHTTEFIFFRANSCSRRITNPIGGQTVRPETTLFLPHDPDALAVLAEAASDDLQQHLAGVRYKGDVPEVVAICSILLFMEYHDDGIFPLLWHLAPPLNTNDDTEHSPAQGGITVEGDLEQLNEDSARSDSISVRQRADSTCQLLHRRLNS